ncbi:MAG: hypothetical protein ACLFOY_19695, partial [Desulfatibacillaceae bacterium]
LVPRNSRALHLIVFEQAANSEFFNGLLQRGKEDQGQEQGQEQGQTQIVIPTIIPTAQKRLQQFGQKIQHGHGEEQLGKASQKRAHGYHLRWGPSKKHTRRTRGVLPACTSAMSGRCQHTERFHVPREEAGERRRPLPGNASFPLSDRYTNSTS